MKLTWFGGTCLRVQISGQIFVLDAAQAVAGTDAGELAAGSDRVLALRTSQDDGLMRFDAGVWRPRRAARMIDRREAEPANVWRLDTDALLIEGSDEGLLAIVAADSNFAIGGWADGAVIVAFGGAGALVALGRATIGVVRPRLLAFGVTDGDQARLVDELAPAMAGAGLQLFEPGLALEV